MPANSFTDILSAKTLFYYRSRYFLLRKVKIIFLLIICHHNGITFGDIAIDDDFRESIFQIALDGTLQRTGAKLHIVALACYEFLGFFVDRQGESNVAHSLI